MSDDLGYARLGYTGSTRVDTPHIDSIIREGVFFTNGYVSSPVCAPSRAGLLTGRYPVRAGFEAKVGPIDVQVRADLGLDTSEVLLSEMLQDVGYATGAFGKWHLGYNEKYRPRRRGFGRFFGFLGGNHDVYRWDAPPAKGGPILRDDEPVDGEGYVPRAIAQEAAAFVRENAERPFFLYLATPNIHSPFAVPEEFVAADGDVVDGMVRALDANVGLVLSALEEEGLSDETLIVYVNDNGGRRENGRFRGGKGSLYEGGIRVPFAIRWPGRIPAGETRDFPVVQLDVVPTVAAATGASLPDDRPIDGVDLLPFIGIGAPAESEPHDALYWHHPHQGRAVRAGRLKLLQRVGYDPELFDLEKDPGELHDLARSRSQEVDRLLALLDAWSGVVVRQRQ